MTEFSNDFFVTPEINKPKARACDSFGAVIYGVRSLYENCNDLSSLHILPERSLILQCLQKHIEAVHVHVKVKNILIGHEHGKENNKCHYQTIIWLEKPCYISLQPAELHVEDGTVLLFMAQHARNPHALRNYCKKDGDYTYLNPEIVPKMVMMKGKGGEMKINAFATVSANADIMTADEKMDLLMQHEPRTALTMYKNIEYALEKTTKPVLPDPEWIYPQHLIGKYPLIETWFYKWAVPSDLPRRKALLLYSTKRALGKTQFASRLLNDPTYVVTFRTTFAQGFVDGKIPKLVILDDMNCYTKDNKETWKALVAGEPTAIRDAYMNYTWQHRVPCIITTNNAFLVHQLMTSDAFNTQVDMIEITEYMGPLGTRPDGLESLGEMQFTQSTLEVIKQFAARDSFEMLGKKTSMPMKVENEYKKKIASLEEMLTTQKQLNGGLMNEVRQLKESNNRLMKELSVFKFNTKPSI